MRQTTRKSRPALALPALAACAVLGLPGAALRAQPETAPPPFREVTGVNVVNVEVAVTDRQGRPVTGLARDAFELFENGDRVEISNFFAVEAGRTATRTAVPDAAGPAPLPAGPRIRQNHLIVYVDNANITARNRRKVFDSLREFVRSNWRPDLWAMVVSNDRSLTIRREFTTDFDAVLATLDELQRESPAEPRHDPQRRMLMELIEDVNVEAGSGYFGTKTPGDISQESYSGIVEAQAQALLPQIRNYSQERLQHTRDTLRVLDQFLTMAAGMPGRKAVLYVSDGLSLRPGEALYEGFSRRFLPLAEATTSISPDLEALSDDASGDFRDLVTRANTGGVTFYTVDASPTAPLVRGSAETTAGAGGNFGSWKDAVESTEQTNRQDSLIMMADGTGGRYGLTPSTFDDLFDGILTDFDNFYSLGYVADRLERGRKRDIKVKLRGDPNGLLVRYRRSFRDKTPLEQAAERAQAGLLVADLDNPLGISIEPRDRELQDDGNYVVHLLVKLDLAKLALLPAEEVARGDVSVFVAGRDEKGRASAVRRIVCPIRVPASAAGDGGTAACGVRLLMRAGRQKVAVSVLDETAAVHSTTSLMLEVGPTSQAALAAPTG